jgi:hypothetical protein
MPPPTGGVDEVKYAYGDTADTVVFSWRGSERTIWYGVDSSYGSQAVAVDSAITPVDIVGPFREVALSGLQPGTTYHYRIGESGQDSTFSTAPAATDSFRAISIGDTIASTCRVYQRQMNQLVLDQNADFMIHGGDIAIANECGEPAVHQYYLDIEPFTRRSAFMPVWGNHEYGQPTANAPAGTPRDTLANYKGRSYIPNAQTVPSDTSTQTSHPGCGQEIGSPVNTCRGEDWGFFRAGGVLFISYPEPWSNAITDWQAKATAIMEQAHDDPSIDFIVTYGHRPVLSSTSWTPPAGYDAAFRALGDRFSPTSRPDGKYVLNIAQHRHNLEVFDNYRGVTHVVNGGGGQGLLGFSTILTGSTFRLHHLGFSTLDYNADENQLTFRMICGPSISYERSTCTAGSTIFTKTFE